MASVRSIPSRIGTTVRGAIGLLTRIPVGPLPNDVTGAAAFPAVGFVVGVFGAAACLLLAPTEPAIAAIAAVATMALLSGALHYDGVADTADALVAVDAIRAEAARHDPAIGAGGAVALIAVIGLQVAALASIASSPAGTTDAVTGPVAAAWACLVAAIVSRTIPVVAARVARATSVRSGNIGFGAWFIDHVSTRDAVTAVILAIVILAASYLAGAPVPLLAAGAVGAALGGAALAAIVARRGRLDGDGFGASIELTMAAVLGCAAFLG